MLKRTRDLLQKVKEAGIELVEATENSSGGYRYLLRAPNEKEQWFSFHKTPAFDEERREIHLLQAFARENPKGEVTPESISAIGRAMRGAERLHNIVVAQTQSPVPTIKEITMDSPIIKPSVGKIRKISQIEFYRLCNWLKSNVTPGDKRTQVRIAEEASLALSFTISTSSISTGLKAVGITLGGGNSVKTEKANDIRALAEALTSLLRELGKEVPEGVRAILERRG